MPLLLQQPLEAPGEWGIWSITEPEAALREAVLLYPREIVQLNAIRGAGRRREFLAARLLLHTMSGRGRRGELIKDEFGKPHLTNSPFHVSISHTHGYSAAVAHPRPCGIDIQTYVPRIRRLARKFVGPAEAARLPADPAEELTHLHLLWSAKEAVYKAYGRRQLDFREHMMIDLEHRSAELRKDDLHETYRLTYHVNPDYVVVTVVRRTLSP